ncbi:hypothetical protein CDAR_533531 [Caerostris darwini]|uniref:Uncharacterized protein n=1 Tax=Caerostris darwini TaxID=1538125 RepID=A0AAV4S6X0_9ARAC|nr:hypothetical protein CDAR_533531 [Caerostris darwini]
MCETPPHPQSSGQSGLVPPRKRERGAFIYGLITVNNTDRLLPKCPTPPQGRVRGKVKLSAKRERETSKCSGSLTQLKRIPGLPDRLFNCGRQRLKGSSRKIFIANKKQSEPTAVPSKTHSLGDKE